MYHSSPQGGHLSSPSSLTRRRFKAFLPILVALIVIPFFVSAFYGGGKSELTLVAKARGLYNKNGDSLTSDQASLSEKTETGVDIEDGDHMADYGPGSIIETAYGSPDDEYGSEPDVEDGNGPDEGDLDYDLPDADDLDTDYGSAPFSHHHSAVHQKPGKSLLDLMDFPDEDEEDVNTIPDRGDYRELFSLTTRDRRFIPLFIEGTGAYGPNVVPHPTKFDMWIVLAQRLQPSVMSTTYEQIVCTAGILNGVLICGEAFENLTMSSFVQGACEGDLAYYNNYSGARDARLFYGPSAPFVLYGSQSQHTCLGMWLQDARALLEPYHLEKPLAKLFSQATEVQRLPPLKGLETNYFIFWDADGKAYAHYQIWPRRSFAQLDWDGSVGEDLAPAAAKRDQVCVARYMQTIQPSNESLQQASNSLAITLCDRTNPKCKPSESNTFLMHIFHHTFDYDSHIVHEPFVMLFQQTAPFALHAISQRALWIHGRQALTNETGSPQYPDPEDIPTGHTERFAVTSISWKNHVQRYHGYIDDTMMIGVSVEDSRAGIMDVKASDLVQDLAFC
ncbi:uncharacterized protein LTR77_008250 [Saxophila tyrrhenica]|uniref:Uncharacterized protein n=1 Tax=Saxophila tyrrhenica TaxID=1690608 RepID=A0AAV9P525_9PEZI|nr:hypothetical protein LTR77_008250 [Saxophila tyrrhenica]